MKKVVIAFLLFQVVLNANSQGAAKAIFFELGGPGLASINFDTRFAKKEDGIGARLGFSGLSFNFFGDRESVFLFPAGLNYLIGKDNKNYFELGAGITFIASSGSNSNSSDDDDLFESTFGHLNFGYRLQPANGGFFFRAAINPIIAENRFFPFYGGISFGYKFGGARNKELE